MFVLDASALLPRLFEDEDDAWTRDVLSRLTPRHPAVVPSLFLLEVTDALSLGVRRRRLTLDAALAALRNLGLLPIVVDDRLDRTVGGMLLAVRHGLSAYDACYLRLAIGRELPLATRDEELARAAHAEGVALVG